MEMLPGSMPILYEGYGGALADAVPSLGLLGFEGSGGNATESQNFLGS